MPVRQGLLARACATPFLTPTPRTPRGSTLQALLVRLSRDVRVPYRSSGFLDASLGNGPVAALAALLLRADSHPPLVPALSTLLSSRPLPLSALALLYAALRVVPRSALLARFPSQAALAALAAWSDTALLARAPVPLQSFRTEALLLLLGLCESKALPGAAVRPLLEGVSARLGSALVSVRRHGMRVGNRFAEMTQGSRVFDDDPEVDVWTSEERWTGAAPGAAAEPGVPGEPGEPGDPRPTGVEGAERERSSEKDVGGKWTIADAEEGVDSDDERESTASEDSLDAYEMPGEVTAEERDAQGRAPPASLPDLVLALRAPDDAPRVVAALRVAEDLVRAAPDELPLYAAELAQVLAHTKAPTWAATAEDQRQGAFLALLCAHPDVAGRIAIRAAFADGMDLSQRVATLESLRQAALALAAPPGATISGALKPPSLPRSSSTPPVSAPTVNSRTRVWGPRSRAVRLRGAPAHFSSRLPAVAPAWMAALLRGLGTRQTHLDVLGRDHLVLGRTLSLMAAIAQGAALSDQGTALVQALLETLGAPTVREHSQPFVRRMALFAAAEAVAAIPAGALAGALTCEGSLASLTQRTDAWARAVAEADADETCRALARTLVARCGERVEAAAEVMAREKGGEAGLLRDGGDVVQRTLAEGLGRLHVSIGSEDRHS